MQVLCIYYANLCNSCVLEIFLQFMRLAFCWWLVLYLGYDLSRHCGFPCPTAKTKFVFSSTGRPPRTPVLFYGPPPLIVIFRPSVSPCFPSSDRCSPPVFTVTRTSVVRHSCCPLCDDFPCHWFSISGMIWADTAAMPKRIWERLHTRHDAKAKLVFYPGDPLCFMDFWI